MECEIGDDLCIEKYQKNAAMIQVFYEELNYETLIESPAYTVGNFPWRKNIHVLLLSSRAC